MNSQTIYEGALTRVLRVTREDGTRRVHKQVLDATPGTTGFSNLERERDLLRLVDGRGAPKAIGLEAIPDDPSDAWQLVLEDVGAQPSALWIEAARSSPERALRTALGIAEALAKIHDCGVLHRDVTPSNVIVHPQSGEVWMIDFGLALPASRGHVAAVAPEVLEGTLAYIAPEQTGRMNRGLDARSDLYGLGATLYDLFGGAPPFVRDDILGYVHAHLAVAPPPLRPVVDGLPAAALELVMTLLSKRPEDRYQSAAGVVIDLRRLLASLEGSDETLPLVGRAVGREPELPEGLLGRERESATLLAAFERARAGGRATAWVTGAPGIGKTTLVHELVRPVTLAGGRMMSGKFDQFARDVPFAGLRAVLERFAREVTAGPAPQVDRWRDRLIERTAPNTQLLLDIAPGLTDLLGPQPAVSELPPTPAQARLDETVRRAIRGIATRDEPLVLFLDDLQWADAPSLRVIEALFRDPELAHLLLVGAWRDDEVGASHPLQPTIAAIAEGGTPNDTLALGPLSIDEVRRWVAVGLQRQPDDVAALVDRLFEKTGGNPYFLRRLVEQAAARGAIRFDHDAVAWRWELEVVEGLALADNVVALLQGSLRRLGDDARLICSAAALLGEGFDRDALVFATELDTSRVAAALSEAMNRRCIVPLDLDYWLEGSRSSNRFRFSFAHDRVQQAARELLSEVERAQIHLRIARRLTEALRGEDSPFKAAEHYCAALGLVDDPEELAGVVRLLGHAGEWAMRTAAHPAAHRFLHAAIACTPEDFWSRSPDEAVALWSAAAKSSWLVGRDFLMDRHVAKIRENVTDMTTRLRATEIVVQAKIARGQLHEALSAAVEVLGEAGVHLSRHPTGAEVGAAVGATLAALGDRSIETIAAERCDDALEAARRGLMARICSGAYVAEPNLLPLIACELVQRSVAHGVSRESSYGFGVFSLVLTAGWHLALGETHGRNALWLLETIPDREFEGIVRHVVYFFSHAFTRPLREVHDDAADVFRTLMNVGDLEYAAWALLMRVTYGFWSGMRLERLHEEIEHAVDFMRLNGSDAALQCTLPYRHLLRALRGEHEDASRLVSADYDEAAALEALRSVDFSAAVLVLATCMQVARTVAEDRAGASEATRLVMEHKAGALGVFYQCPMRVLGAVAEFSAVAEHGPGSPAVLEALERVLPWREQVAASATHNPHNAEHSLALFDAEVAAARGDLLEATVLYDRAIESAAATGFTHIEALACERAYALHAARSANKVAHAYLVEARRAWERWGALAKVAALDAAHPQLARENRRRPAQLGASQTTSSRDLSLGSLDLASLLKASRAIAEETDLERLLTRSMDILLENTGARRGVLFLAHRGGLRLEAVINAEGRVELLGGVEHDGRVAPDALIRRVWRTGVAEIHDALGPEGLDDAYLEGRDPISALCVRVANRGQALGVLYFENDLATSAFTDDRMRVLDVLAPQLGVSVRNARLLAAQNRFVPRQFIRSLELRDIVDVEVGDHKIKEISVFFSDIWGYTPLVEKMSAAEALGFLNRYLSYAEPAITNGRGFIDTYLGDGIMALFDEAGTNAQDAVAAGVALHRALDRFNDERRRNGERPVRTGVGINTGEVTLSTIGGQNSLKCGVVGDAVNLAARVEQLTRQRSCRLLISESTRERLTHPGAFDLRRAGRVRVKGRKTPLTVFEVLDAEPDAVRDPRVRDLADFEAALSAYYAGEFQDALEGFTDCVSAAPGDALARHFLQATETLLRDGVPEGWTGVEILTRK